MLCYVLWEEGHGKSLRDSGREGGAKRTREALQVEAAVHLWASSLQQRRPVAPHELWEVYSDRDSYTSADSFSGLKIDGLYVQLRRQTVYWPVLSGLLAVAF